MIVSPFAQTTSSVSAAKTPRIGAWSIWLAAGLSAVIALSIAGYFVCKYFADPYRTLELFSEDKYLADFQPLSGSKFRAEFRVVADLGWKENVGRLMVFSAQDDSRPILVLIPPRLSGIFFSKGQNYQVALEVGEGGLIYADSCEKE